MDASAASDALRDPSATLLELYKTHHESDDFPAIVHEHFSNLFRTSDAFRTIPALSVKQPPEAYPPGALVRFRAMIQDTSLSPEMYMSRLGDGRCGGWNLETSVEESLLEQSDYTNLRECHVVWVISIPGESDWVSDVMDGRGEASDMVHQPPRPHKSPLPDISHVGVQAKIYHNAGPDPKPTELVEFVGVLHTDLLHAELVEESISVPTLHVLFSRPVDRSQLFRDFPSVDSFVGVRQQLISWIADQALAGDTYAAEWGLLASIAQVQARQTPLFPPSLTLSKLPPPPSPSTIPTLYTVLCLLLPQVVAVPATLDKLNKERFAPESKDEDLHSGYLQVPAGTTVLISEVGLQEGKLHEKGIANVLATQNAMTTQTLSYVFPYSQFSFSTDINFIVMTEGSKSAFFKTDVIVPVQSSSGSLGDYYDNEDDIAKSPELGLFRQYLQCARSKSVRVGEQTSQFIQSDFVESRQQNLSLSPEDLILRMKIAKLMAQSLNLEELNPETWQRSSVFLDMLKERTSL